MSSSPPPTEPRATAVERARARRAARRGLRAARGARAKRRGVALIMVLGAITILTVMLAEFQDEASSEAAAAIADRDALKAEYIARSAVSLSRLLIASEPTIRQAVGPLLSLLLGGGSAPQIRVWEFADQVLGAFNDVQGAQSFSALSGVDVTQGKNLGIKGARFELAIVDEDSKININLAAHGDTTSELQIANQLLGLMQGTQYDPLFENRDGDNQFTDRQSVCGAIVDWADDDEALFACDPRNNQATTQATEDNFYQQLKVPYKRKNAAFDSLEELHMVRGVSDEFFSTFIEPDAADPKKRSVTVWGQGKVNVNGANGQNLLAIVCGLAVQNPPQALCTDPTVMTKFLMAVDLMQGFTAGAPLFTTPAAFVKAMQGKGMFGQVLDTMLGVEPVKFTSTSDAAKAVTIESKMFSIYADGVVPGFRRTTHVRIHAVVDFRNAPPPGEFFAGVTPPDSGSSGAATSTATARVAAPTSSAGTASGSTATGDSLAGALVPSPGGTIVYYRIE